jgi:hypothetical protein
VKLRSIKIMSMGAMSFLCFLYSTLILQGIVAGDSANRNCNYLEPIIGGGAYACMGMPGSPSTTPSCGECPVDLTAVMLIVGIPLAGLYALGAWWLKLTALLDAVLSGLVGWLCLALMAVALTGDRFTAQRIGTWGPLYCLQFGLPPLIGWGLISKFKRGMA